MSLNRLKYLKEKFGIKVFIFFTICIFFISFSFTIFFIRNQTALLTHTLITNGNVLTKILAHNAIIGVFSENVELLREPVAGIFQLEGILRVAVFNMKGELLAREEKTQDTQPGNKYLESPLKAYSSPFYIEEKDAFHFFAPVVIGPEFSTEDALLFDEPSPKKEKRIIGFVKISLDKSILKNQVRELLLKSILIGISAILIGSFISYFIVRSVTKPLNQLTEDVKAIEKGEFGEKVIIETDDEIGKLANAFNKMSGALKKREGALKESEKTLRFLSSHLFKAQEQERKRLSRELHDSLGQTLALLKHRLRYIEKGLVSDRSRLETECVQTVQYVDQIIEDVRRLSRDLSPSILEDLGLSAALGWLIENFKKQYAINVVSTIENIDPLFSSEEQTNLYRLAQEIMTNIGKHATASRVMFNIGAEDNFVTIRIEDNGMGFDVEKVKNINFDRRGMGLAAMNERANMLRASINIKSREGVGTKIALLIPVRGDRDNS